MFLAVTQAVNYLTPLWITKLSVSQLGMFQFGEYSFYSYVFVFTNNILLYGFSFFGTSLVAKNKNNKPFLKEIFNDSIYVKGALLMFLFPIMSVFLYFQKNTISIWILINGLIYLLGGVIFSDWFWQGVSNFKLLLKATILSKVLFVITCFFFLPRFPKVTTLLFFDAISYLTSALLLYLNFPQKGTKVSLTRISNLIRIGFPTFISVFLTGFFISLNGVYLKMFHGNTLTGIFSTADKIVFISVGFLNLFNRVIYPRLSNSYSSNPELFPLLVKKNLVILFVISLICGCFSFIFSEYIVSLIIKNDTDQVSKVVKYLTLYIIISPIGSYLSLILIINQKAKRLVIVTFVSALSNLILSIYLVPRYELIGTCISISISAVIVPLILLIYYNKTILFYETTNITHN